MVFPEPNMFNVTHSPLDGCGGGFGVHPRNQTIYPTGQQSSTSSPTTAVTHEIVTYHTPAPTIITTATPEVITSFPTLIPTTEETYPFPTDIDMDASSTEVPIIPGSVGPVEVTPETPMAESTTLPPAPATTLPEEAYSSLEDLLNTTQEPLVPQESTTSGSQLDESTPFIPESSEMPVDQEPTTVIPPESSETPIDQQEQTTAMPVIEESTELPMPEPSELPIGQPESTPAIPEPSALPLDQETTSANPEPEPSSTESIPEPSALPIDQQAITPSIPEPSELPIDQEYPTPGMPEPSELPLETTTFDNIPFPSELPTDDFVIGHWFSTEDSSERTTTESSEFSITATIGNIDLVTVSTPITSSTEPIPTPPASLGNGKLLVLKMRVPEGIDVNSPDFARNITMSLKRLVRDTRTKVERRIKRNAENQTDDDPLKVKQIMKFDNITVVTFSFENFEVTQEELEKALYDLETKDLNAYFDFPTMEHISAMESTYKNLSIEEESDLPYLLFIVLGIIILILVLGSFYFLNHGETTMILKRMGRHFAKYTAPAHSPPQEAFQTA